MEPDEVVEGLAKDVEKRLGEDIMKEYSHEAIKRVVRATLEELGLL